MRCRRTVAETVVLSSLERTQVLVLVLVPVPVLELQLGRPLLSQPPPGRLQGDRLSLLHLLGLPDALAGRGRWASPRAGLRRGPDLEKESRETWQWGDCGDSLRNSSKFVKEFLDWWWSTAL
ncbi:hypothetical protein CB1_001776013 [Camelus ferus]|nr:hypothetical protein CB1_001776013 [Camelus ferus]